MILECNSPEEAQRLVDEDPFSRVGYYASVSIVEILAADESNNFHLQSVLDYLAASSPS